jgi:D-amino-acid dehydrogenase
MMRDPSNSDVVVIGGGVIGVCAAYELAGKGVRVTLLEQQDIAAGASYGNGGLIVPSHSVPLAAPGVPVQGLKWMFNPESPFYIKPRFDLEFFDWMLRFAFASRRGPMMRAIPVLRDLLLAGAKLFAELAEHAGFEFGYAQKGALMVYLSPQKLEVGIEEADLLKPFGIETRVLGSTEVCTFEPTLRSSVAGGIHYLQDAHLDPGALCYRVG